MTKSLELFWTNECPQKPGWYWKKTAPEMMEADICIVKIVPDTEVWDKITPGRKGLYIDWEECVVKLERYISDKVTWAGPISEPKSDKGD